VPHLISRGGRAILVVRDPRDMITSLNFRDRDNLTGENRPVLYSLRAWRKSIAFCLALEDDPRFLWIRYEQLATDPMTQLDRIARFLEIPAFETSLYANGIRHQDGFLWKGNSSFVDQVGVGTSSVGKYQELLPPSVLAFIEATCLPEMQRVGYALECGGEFNQAAIRDYRDPFTCIHAKFPSDYSHSADRVQQEIDRVLKLQPGSEVDAEERRRWYLFDGCYEKLREPRS